MDHCKDSENVIMHNILCVKLEPFDEVQDCTQNIDPLQPDSHVHTQMELLQDFKTEIESDGSNQAMNKLIQEHMLKSNLGDTGTKIEEVNIKTEYIDNEASFAKVLDSRGIIEDNTSADNQHAEKNSSTNTGEKISTRYELSHSCEPQRFDVINEMSTDDGSSFNVTSSDNHSRARSDIYSSGVDVLMIHKHSTSEEQGSKQSYSVIAHSPPHTSYERDVCNMSFKNSRDLVGHKVVHTHQKPHVCDVCKKGFSQSFDLFRHKCIRTGQKPYSCDTCKKAFGRSSDLVKHKRIHTGEKPYVCDICKKGFSASSSLVGHKRIHTGQKPYACDICTKGFSDPSTLVKHKRIHTGEKPYVCDICKKGFSNSFTLVTHKRIHTGEKPYVCDICKKGFSQSSYMVTHKRIHTGEKPYSCEICKKGFSHSSHLVMHKRIHTSDRPFACDICNKAFRRSSDLVKHKRVHTGEKPYICDICKKEFSQSCSLAKHHKRIHTGQ